MTNSDKLISLIIANDLRDYMTNHLFKKLEDGATPEELIDQLKKEKSKDQEKQEIIYQLINMATQEIKANQPKPNVVSIVQKVVDSQNVVSKDEFLRAWGKLINPPRTISQTLTKPL